ncbi:unnamed protein product [Schistosoma bovis]|nr:unnamed protein product [Schistosoma bovis]CAH8641740.1 unnamed protein product [Schistosoma bovis]
MAISHTLGTDSLVSHAFNRDGTELALSVNTSDVYLLSVPESPSGRFQVIDVLREHSALVTSIDWAPQTNRIVSCSADRNAYVWNKQSDNKWKPTLVLLMIDRAAVCVKWSPLEDRFAVGSGSKLLAVCWFDEESDWWIGKKIKKPIRSTVTCIDWHPNNVLLACGSSDFHARIFSAFTSSGPSESVWGKHTPLGAVLFDYSDGEGGWVLSVSFSADGNKLAWTKHNSTIFVADASISATPIVTRLRTDFLPFVSCIWIGPSTFVAGGYDCCPMLFRYNEQSISFVHQLDTKSESRYGGKVTAMKKFQDIDRMATADNTSSRLPTIHQNCINEIRILKGDRSMASELSSVGRDGNLVLWNFPTLSEQIADLKIV